MKKIAFVAVVLCTVSTAWAADKAASSAAAAPAATMAPASSEKKMDMAMDMKPAAEMDKMKGMIGTWKCDGKSADHGKPTMHAIKSVMKMSSELGGHWIMVNYDEAMGVTVRHGRYSSELEVTTAKPENSGNYSCVPSNAKPSSIHVHILNGESINVKFLK